MKIASNEILQLISCFAATKRASNPTHLRQCFDAPIFGPAAWGGITHSDEWDISLSLAEISTLDHRILSWLTNNSRRYTFLQSDQSQIFTPNPFDCRASSSETLLEARAIPACWHEMALKFPNCSLPGASIQTNCSRLRRILCPPLARRLLIIDCKLSANFSSNQHPQLSWSSHTLQVLARRTNFGLGWQEASFAINQEAELQEKDDIWKKREKKW